MNNTLYIDIAKKLAPGEKNKDIRANLVEAMIAADAKGKNIYSAAMGKLGGSKGGKTSAANMSEKARKDRGFLASVASRVARGIEVSEDDLERAEKIRRKFANGKG